MLEKTVLIVDDDPMIRQLLFRLLKMHGVRDVLTAADGFEAIKMMNFCRVDLVFMDINMPDLDGWTLCEMIRGVTRWSKIPIVFQSALEGVANIKRALSLGAHSYLEKPFTKDRVRTILDNIFNTVPLKVESLDCDSRLVIDRVAQSTLHTFNLVLGVQSQIAYTRTLDDTVALPRWDFAGAIHADGLARIDLGIGLTEEAAAWSAASLLQLPREELGEEMIMDGMREILNIILGSAINDIRSVIPVRLGLPVGRRHSSIPCNEQAARRFGIGVGIEDRCIPLILTLDEGNETMNLAA